MAISETAVNLTEVTKAIYPLISGNIAPLINLAKAAGIVFIIYILFLIYQSFMRIKDRRRLKRIEEKLDILISKTNKKKK